MRDAPEKANVLLEMIYCNDFHEIFGILAIILVPF